ncbi:MAG: hypothetical protein FJZ63_05600 [Chlamydiae bacterium]|nr:hypothetical protein [Chlamydiota bacterium]
MKVKPLFYSLLVVALMIKGYDKLVDGFYLYKVRAPKNLLSIQQLPLGEGIAHSSVTSKALAQPFYYLASGSQCFVFLSLDKKFILKLFKYNRWIPANLEGLRATYTSCLYSMQELAQETALIDLQLIPNPCYKQTLTLYNRLGCTYKLPLSSTAFILQSYAQPIPEALLGLKKAHQDEKAKQLINHMLDYLLLRREKGFTDKDPNLLSNFGLIEARVVSLDVGGLIKDPKKDLPYFYGHELEKVKRKLLPWLRRYYPELADYAGKKIQDLQNDFFKQVLS